MKLGHNPDVTPALPMFDSTAQHGEERMKDERDKTLITLGVNSPLRGNPWIEQDDVDGLALFDVARSPQFL
jgi:hypothetical protein